MDKSWIDKPTGSVDWAKGVKTFLSFAVEKSCVNGKIYCPCTSCYLRFYKPIDEVKTHIIFNGFWKEYKIWHHHGEREYFHASTSVSSQRDGNINVRSVIGQDDIRGLVRDVYGVNMHETSSRPTDGLVDYEFTDNPSQFDHFVCEQSNGLAAQEKANKEASNYRKLLDEYEQELYSGCKDYTKLSFVLHLLHIKCMCGWSSKSFTMLLKLLTHAFPQLASFPSSYYEAKKFIRDLGLDYEKIDACPNDCMLYWGERSNQQCCHLCGLSRWKVNEGRQVDGSNAADESCDKKKSAKVLRYFPLIPRLKRMYMSNKIAADMIWHDKDRTKDGILRHPADALAWKEFDNLYPDFAADPRNVRLGLSSDGFNPFRTMSTTYSTWPVLLIPYNLPPWLCMKPSTIILSMIIPGEKAPGNDIDVYLEPLVHELKLLWEGVDAFDAFTGQAFKMRASLNWTVNDFPAYANLSGWSTKGKYACPCCGENTHSTWLSYSKKFCYMGHRKWLPDDHDFRTQDKEFDGCIEDGHAPVPLSGSDILRQCQRMNHEYGKGKKPSSKKRSRNDASTSTGRGSSGGNYNDILEDDQSLNEEVFWKKRSIFFDLPYWEHNCLRHNLDVMHIEKNVCDNLLGTLLNLDGKTKDNEKARRDLVDLRIRSNLHPSIRDNKLYLPPAPYTLSNENKENFLKVLKFIKVPDGYASNISRCVNLKERRLSNLKSHDCHVLVQDIIPIALRASKSIKIADIVSDLCSFFKALCSKVIDPRELDDLQLKVVIMLCKMEKVFPPSFFTVMIHLMVHLVEEVRLGGPVPYRWMYPVERYLMRLKAYVRNRAQPEGSMAEGYIADECLTFCSRYFKDVETLFNKPRRNDSYISNIELYLFNSGGRILGIEESFHLDDKSLAQAHRYVLLHAEQVGYLRSEFLSQKKRESRRRGILADHTLEARWIVREFSDWLKEQVPNIDASMEEGKLVKALARGINPRVKRMKAFTINGYKFHTLERERKRKTQNSGVMVEAMGINYYGRLTDIFELDFYGDFKVVVFRCDWIDIHSPRGIKQDEDGFVSVNFSKLIHTGERLEDDPFVFSSQAKQVFYVEDVKKVEWLHVVKTKPRDLYDLTNTPTVDDVDYSLT